MVQQMEFHFLILVNNNVSSMPRSSTSLNTAPSSFVKLSGGSGGRVGGRLTGFDGCGRS
ncbi:hypothetical protein DPMN_127098 [Dreissena polymorpha]|uniref:Uncharacterized protein n=1 Tax=Dreissena polymorpha TaxID=45954 RepID=A0A9D4H1E3_DREPO|nr:hypothetical protein DPMN_127098 [Dreissena polymorpha]